jgi:hypothetical protein
VTSPPPLPCGVVEFTPQGKPSPLEGEGRVGGKKINSFVLVSFHSQDQNLASWGFFQTFKESALSKKNLKILRV